MEISNIKKFESAPSLKIGDIAQLYVHHLSNKIIADKSDGSSPLGIVVKKAKVRDKKTGNVKNFVVYVNVSQNFLETDNFDYTNKFPINASLFINSKSLFSTIQEKYWYPCVGSVVGCPTSSCSKLKLLWR